MKKNAIIQYKNPEDFSSLIELMDYFDTEQKCRLYFEYRRWKGQPKCPHCKHDKVYRFKDGKRFKCASCMREFSIKVGTIFENSNIPLRKWFIAIYLIISHKKGISSYQLSRDIKVTQATAWFMLHRIRFKLGDTDPEKQLSGRVEADETFVGGKNKNRHKDKKVPKSQGRSFKDKTPVMGLLQEQVSIMVVRPNKIIPSKLVLDKIVLQQSQVRCKVVPNTQSSSIQPEILKSVAKGSILISDEWKGYTGLSATYNHRVVDHSIGKHTNETGDTTNSIEGFWALLKRAYIGVYHYMSRKHMQNYADEVAFRYNTRDMRDTDRVVLALTLNNDRVLTYKQLIGKA